MTKCLIPECPRILYKQYCIALHNWKNHENEAVRVVFKRKPLRIDLQHECGPLLDLFVPLIPIKEKKCACGDSHVGLSTRPKLMLKVEGELTHIRHLCQILSLKMVLHTGMYARHLLLQLLPADAFVLLHIFLADLHHWNYTCTPVY